MEKEVTLYWFRQDLRLSDNPSFYEAAQQGVVLPLYILDDQNAGDHAWGAASRWWLHHSLKALNESLEGKLNVFSGNPHEIFQELSQRYNVKGVYWNRCYEPWAIQRDKALKASLIEKGLDVNSFNGSLLWEPWEIKKDDGTPYKVFTPFYRKGCLKAALPRFPLPKPAPLELASLFEGSLSLEDLNLLPTIRWDKALKPHWEIGEKGAQKRLSDFLEEGIQSYKEGRNFPAKPFVSKLSPHLSFGEISPHQVWSAARMLGEDANVDHFCSELGWREFSYSQLYYNPELPWKNLQSKFDTFPWKQDHHALEKWQQGQTGVPIVDAGMRQLWQTGYIHNRVRMIVGSYLVKNLLIDWREGERWFWDCLVDADLANNSASWQWIAGCGADAAPYFRIFNPVTQGQKFDPDGEYTRQFVPELSSVPLKYLFSPWEAPQDFLEKVGVVLGKNYPRPLVDLKLSREQALEAFKRLGEKT